MNRYVDEFMKLRCAGDVLNCCPPMNKAAKEITESMAVIKRLKPIVLQDPMKYRLVDLCAGNALTSVLAVHMFPVRSAIAYDRMKRKGHYESAKRFDYIEGDIKNFHPFDDDILIAVHPCQTADLVVGLFNLGGKSLILEPCCSGNSRDVLGGDWLKSRAAIDDYDIWTLHLAQKIEKAKVSIYTDRTIMSPKNNIIVAVR